MSTQPKEIAFIDANLADLEQLVAGLRSDVEPIVLRANQSAPEQMARAIAGISELSAVHIVAHGQSGEIQFSGGALSLENLEEHSEALFALGLALADDGVVQLYSCNVAEGQRGQHFVKDLAERVGAHVFASAGKVGAEALGGNWSLSECTSNDSPVPHVLLTAEAANGYVHVLNIAIDLATDYDTGVDNDDGITKYSAVTISGTGGTALNYVQFTIGATTYSPVLVGFGGIFTFNTGFLPEGTYTIFAQEFNATLTGTVGIPTSTVITIDQTVVAPSAPNLDAIWDSGISDTDNLTKYAAPTVSGNGAEAGATVTLLEGATVLGTAVANGAGEWSITSSTLSDGTHSLTAKQTDVAGNVSTVSSGLSVTIDSTPPTAGSLAFINLTDTGSSPSDGITQDDTFDLVLTGQEVGTTVAYEVSLNGGGTWSGTTASQVSLADGAYQFRAEVTDAAGNSADTAAIGVTVDKAVAAPGFALAVDTGASGSDGITSNGQVDVTLAADVASWEYSTDAGSNWSAGTGTSFTLAEDDYAIGAVQVRQTDTAGNVSVAASNAAVIAVDATVAAPGFALAVDTGASGSDGITSNGQVDVTLAADMASWEYSTDAGSNWSAGTGTSFTLAEDDYAIGAVQVRQTDTAGNVSVAASNAAVIAVDATVAAPGFALAVDTGASGSDGITSNGQVDVTLAADVASWEYSTDAGSNWSAGTGTSFTLAEDDYAIGAVQVRQTDTAGNVSVAASNAAVIAVDATVAAPGFALAVDTGASGSDGITSNGQVDVTLAADVASWEYSTDAGSNWSAGTGTSFTLAEDDYAIGAVQVRQTDTAGNVSVAASNAAVIAVDATVAAPGFALAVDTGASGSDGITSNGQVDVTLAADVASWEYSTDAGSNWSAGTGTSFTLAEDDYAIGAVQVRQTDTAGNVSAAASNAAVIAVDQTADAAPAATLVVGGTADLNVANESVSFVVSGVDGDLGVATVTFSDGSVTPNVVVDVSAGDGSYTADLSSLSGIVTATLDITDTAGNTAAAGGNNVYTSIQAAIDAASAGDTILVADGTYLLGGSTLNVNKSLTIIGESEAGVVIDGSGIDGYGILVNADNTSLSNFTLQGPAAGGASGNYGIKAQPAGSAAGDRLLDLTIDHVTVQGSARSEFDLNGVDGATLSSITADGQNTGGVGIALTDSANITLTDVTTTGNLWGSVALYPSNTYYDQQVDDIVFTGSYSYTESIGIFVDDASTSQDLGTVTFPPAFTSDGDGVWSVTNDTFRGPVDNDSDHFTFFFANKSEAVAFALAIQDDATGAAVDNTRSVVHAPDGTVVVEAGFSIQAAVDAASDNGTITVGTGTYTEQVVIDGKNGLTLQEDSGADVTIEAPTALVSTGQSPTSGRDINGVVTVKNASDVTIQGVTVDGLQNGGAVTGSSNPTMAGITYIDASGSIDGVEVTGIREADAQFGNQRGIGIYIANSDPSPGDGTTTPGSTDTLKSIEIKGSTVENFQKGGIVVSYADVAIHDNTVTGIGGTDWTAQNGIQVSGSTGSIEDNAVTGIGYTGANWSASVILTYYNNELLIDGNTVTGSGSGDLVLGIATINSVGGQVTNNTISDVGWGIDAEDYGVYGWADAMIPGPAPYDYSSNTLSAIGENGLWFQPDAASTDAFDVTGTTGNDVIFGATAGDTLAGGAGNDEIDGGAGADSMSGGTGDDTYAVDNASDTIVESTGEGADTVNASVSYALGAGVEVENLNSTGSGIALTGNEFDQTITGDAGDNVLTGNGGDDTIDGGDGLDTAVFSGAHSAYSVTWDGTTATVGGPDGTDTVTAVGKLSFDDEDVFLVSTTGEYTTIQAAIDAASAGDTILVADGTYLLGGSTLNVNKSLTIIGESEAGVVIDGSGIDGYGILVNADNTSLSNFTLQGPAAGGASGNYGIKAQPAGSAAGDRLLDLTIDHVTVQGSARSEFDLNGVDGATLSSITADGQNTGGVGIALTDSANITLTDVTTTGNLWGSVALYPSNTYYDQQVDDIVFTGSYSYTESIGIFVDDASTSQDLGTVTFPPAFTSDGDGVWSVTNDTFRGPVDNDSDHFTFFFANKSEAVAFALAIQDDATGAAVDNTRSVVHAPDGTVVVEAGFSIQAAVDAASDNGTITVGTGTYTEQVVIDGKNGLTLQEDSGADVTIEAPTALVSTGQSPTSGRDINGVVTVKNASDVTIQGVTVDGLQNGGAVTGSSNPTMAGITYIDASGSIDGVEVTGIREADAQFGNQRGIGIYIANSDPSPGDGTTTPGSTDTLKSIEIKGSTVENFQKGGIVVSYADVAIHDNTVTGIGGTDWTAQNGIQVSGSTGSIEDNAVTGIGYTGANWSASVILTYYNNELLIDGNTVTGSGSGDLVLGIATINSVGGQVTNNTISDVGWGIDAEDYGVYGWADAMIPGPAPYDYSSNTLSAIGENGLWFQPDAASTDAFDVTGTTGNDVIFGATAGDTLAGGAGNDEIDGGAGADSMSGGTGDDTYAVDNASDTIVESTGEGADTVNASVSYALGAGVEVENLNSTGSGIALTGNEFDQTITGDAGDNVLTGNGGDDTIDGGLGADTAVYAGPVSDYAVATTTSGGFVTGFTTVTDTNTGNEGTDTLIGIEVLSFAGGATVIDLADPIQLFDASDNIIGTFDAIDAAVAAAVDGQTIRISDGTYTLTSTLNVNKGLTIIGESEAGVVINAAANGYGIYVSADATSLSNFTLIGTASATYGLKASPGGSSTDRLDDLSIDNVTVQGFGGSEVDLNGVLGATLTNVTAHGLGTAGVGVGISDSADITLNNLETSGNLWGSVALYSTNNYFDQQTDNIVFAGTFVHDEPVGVYADDASATTDLGSVTFPWGPSAWSVTNDAFRGGLNDSANFTFFFATEGEAVLFALAIQDDASGAAVDNTRSVVHDPDGTTLVVETGLSIQAAIDAADEGNTVEVGAGTFAEDLSIADGLAVTIQGQGAATIIAGQITSSGDLNGTLTLQGLDIDASGKQYGVYATNHSTGYAGTIVLDGVDIANATQDGFAYIRAGNGGTPSLTDTVGNIKILNSDFDNNGSSGSNGRGDVLLYGYNQDLTIDASSFTGTAVGSNGTQKAIQLRGVQDIGDTVNSGPYDSAGDVSLTNLSIDGAYAQDAIAIYRIADFNSFTLNNVVVDVSAPWGVFNADEVGGVLDVSGLTGTNNGGGLLSTLQGLASNDTLSGTDGADTLTGRGGNDVLDGGAGGDAALYAGPLPASAITANGSGGWDVAGGLEGSDSLSNVEMVIDGLGHRFLLVGNGGLDTIEAAVAASQAGDTILLAAGNIALGDAGTAQVVIPHELTIIGAGMTDSVILAVADTSSSGDARGMILVNQDVSFSMSDLTLDGNGYDIWQGIRHQGEGSFEAVRFADIAYPASGSGGAYSGIAIAVFGGSGPQVLSVTDSDFANIGRVGVLFYGSQVDGTFSGNTYTGKGTGDHLDYAVEVGAGATVAITGNTISGNQGVAISDGSDSAGVLITTYYGSGSNAILTGNTFADNTAGVTIGYDAADTSDVTFAAGNTFTGSGVGVTVIGDATVGDIENISGAAATVQWNGGAGANTPEGAALADQLSGGDGDDTIVGRAGDDAIDGGAGLDTAVFSGAHSAYTITWDGTTATVTGPDGTDTVTNVGKLSFDGGEDVFLVSASGEYATIQAAVDAAGSGDTVLVAAGTYDEDLSINKGVTILGAQNGVSGTDGARGVATGLAETNLIGEHQISTASDVNIDGLRFVNDATTTGGGAATPTLKLLASAAGGDHTIANSVFYSTVAGGGVDDRAIASEVMGAGTITISANYITGSEVGLYSTASWGRGIWFDGGGVALIVTGNTIEYSRTAINTDMTGSSSANIASNVFQNDGTGLSVGVDGDGVSIENNTFANVDTDINMRNLSDGQTLDAGASGNAAAPGEFFVILGGSGADDLTGTAGSDYIDGNNLNANTDNDLLNGVAGDDYLLGRGGNDTLSGGNDNDTLVGGAGDDSIDGGDNGATGDTVVLSGNRTDYTITLSGSTYTVVDDRAGTPDGTDTVTGVENFEFADNTYFTSGPSAPLLDVVVPTVTSVAYGANDGSLKEGDSVDLIVTFSENVNLDMAGGSPTLTLDTMGTATFLSWVGSSMTFTYTVAALENSADLAVTAFNLNGASIEDDQGNDADLSGAETNPVGTLAVDTTAPAAPTIDAVATDDVVNDSEATTGFDITGTGEVGATVTLSFDSSITLAGGNSAVVDGSGNWSVAVTDADVTAMGEGAESITATQTDVAGNSSAASAPKAITVDTVVVAPTIDAVATDDVVNDSEATTGFDITGTGEVGATVTLSFDSSITLAGGNSAVVDGSGNWSVAVTDADVTAMGEGAESITATQTDVAGNSSAASAPKAITVDTVVVAPTIDAVATDDVVNDSEATTGFDITGTGEVGATVTLSFDSSITLAGGNSAVVDGSGNWSVAVTDADVTAMGEGAESITATQTDVAGNSSAASAPKAITVDTVVVAPTIDAVATDDVVNDSEATTGFDITGTGEVGATVTLSFDSSITLAGGNSAVVDGSGNWSVAVTDADVTAMGEGAESITATQTDVAGNSSAASAPKAITVDTVVVAPTIDAVATDDVVNDSEATTGFDITGTGEVGATVTLSFDSSITLAGGNSAVVDGSGNWSVAVTDADVTAMGEGAESITATQTDVAGNSSAASAPKAITVDTVVVAPTIDAVATDDVVNDSEATTGFDITGTGEVGATVTLSFDSSITLAGGNSAVVDGSGNWSVAVTDADVTAMGEGAESITATQTDVAGNSSAASAPKAITVDTVVVAPTIDAVATDDVVNDSEATTGFDITGTGEVGATVTLSFDSSITLAGGNSAVVDGSGNWSVAVTDADVTAMGEGAESITATQTDVAGNSSAASAPKAITVDTIAPLAFTTSFTQIADDSGIAGDYITNDASVTVNGVYAGTLGVGEKIQVSADAGSVWVDATPVGQNWIAADVALVEGTGTLTTRTIDAAGNVKAGASHAYTLDTLISPPGFALANDTGIDGDGISSDGTVSVTGVEAGATWQYSTNSGATWSTGTGNSFDLAEGTYGVGAVQVRQSDVAGNVSAAGSSMAVIVIDETAPLVPTTLDLDAADDSNIDTDNITNVTTGLTISVSGEDGATMVLFDDINDDGIVDPGESLGSGTVIAGSFSVDADLASEGMHRIKAIQNDVAGNASPVSAALEITIDTIVATPGVALNSDTGISNSDGITSDGTVNVSGLEAGATWLYSTDNGSNWTSGTGSSFTLGQGSYAAGAIQVKQSDLAGNSSGVASIVAAVTVDTTAPVAASTSVTQIIIDSGTPGDFVTSDGNVDVNGLYSGTLGSGETIQVSANGTNWVDATAIGGIWAAADVALVPGPGTLTTRTIDTAGNVTSGASQSYVYQLIYVGTPGQDTLTGTDADEEFYALASDDSVVGAGGNDTIDGGDGADTMLGGPGDDLYYVDNTSDIVVENANEGSDTVLSSVSWTLGDNLENLTLAGTSAIDGIGNSLDNVLTGNDAGNSLDGGAGADTLTGGAGADTLNGGSGADIMMGGAGDDRYTVDNVNDVIVEYSNEGDDLVFSSVSWTLGAHLERLYLTGSAAINGTGNALANKLYGDGNSAANVLAGGIGNDTYYAGAGDVIVEQANQGDDLVVSTIDWTLGANLERLYLSGSAAINGTGNALANKLYGDGNSAANVLAGGGGNDTYYAGVGDSVSEAPGGGTDTVLSHGDYTLDANVEYLYLNVSSAATLTGNTLGNSLRGNAGDDTLIGLAGNDTLYGGLGGDTMIGGAGDDRYDVDNVNDSVIELFDEGSDIVYSSISWTLGNNVERLYLTGSAAISATGNGLDNKLYGDGNSAANVLTGGLGNDTYYAGAGDSIVEQSNGGNDLVVSAVDWTLGANVERLYLTGSAAVNGTGNGLDNTLYGHANSAANVLTGGLGNDSYFAGVGDTIVEAAAGGTDTVYSYGNHSLSANVENLYLNVSSAATLTGNDLDNSLRGNAGADTLIGLAGNDTLDGGAGADTMSGGLGDDRYNVDNVNDSVIELPGEGSDIVYSSVSWTLGANVERLYLTGNAAINATGNELDNTLFGQANSGANVLTGGLGNDRYYVGAGDSVVEAPNAGTDTIYSQGSYSLVANVENLYLDVSSAATLTGNALANSLRGNDGDDTLIGLAGNDTLNGGLGNDTLTGGADSDIIRFDSLLDALSNVDTITDFSVAEDRIHLENAIFSSLTTTGTLAAGSFHVGTAAADADDYVIYDSGSGALYYDADGSGAGAAVQFATLGSGLALTNADFLVT